MLIVRFTRYRQHIDNYKISSLLRVGTRSFRSNAIVLCFKDLKVGGGGVKYQKLIIEFSIIYVKKTNEIHLLIYNT